MQRLTALNHDIEILGISTRKLQELRKEVQSLEGELAKLADEKAMEEAEMNRVKMGEQRLKEFLERVEEEQTTVQTLSTEKRVLTEGLDSLRDELKSTDLAQWKKILPHLSGPVSYLKSMQDELLLGGNDTKEGYKKVQDDLRTRRQEFHEVSSKLSSFQSTIAKRKALLQQYESNESIFLSTLSSAQAAIVSSLGSSLTSYTSHLKKEGSGAMMALVDEIIQTSQLALPAGAQQAILQKTLAITEEPSGLVLAASMVDVFVKLKESSDQWFTQSRRILEDEVSTVPNVPNVILQIYTLYNGPLYFTLSIIISVLFFLLNEFKYCAGTFHV